MSGSRRNLVSQLPAGFPANGSRIWNFTNADTWEPAKEPVHSNYHQVDTISHNRNPGVGPALATIISIGLWSFFPLRPQVFVALILLACASVAAYAVGALDRLITGLNAIALIWSLWCARRASRKKA